MTPLHYQLAQEASAHLSVSEDNRLIIWLGSVSERMYSILLEQVDWPLLTVDEKTAHAATEKHVPVIEKVDSGYKAAIGSTLHPMEEKHYIEWIELLADDKAYRQILNTGDAPRQYSVWRLIP